MSAATLPLPPEIADPVARVQLLQQRLDALRVEHAKLSARRETLGEHIATLAATLRRHLAKLELEGIR